jgi:hypothetical protein
MRAAAAEAGGDPAACRVVLRLVESAGEADAVAAARPALEHAGVDEVIVNVDWEGDLAEQRERLAA